MASSITTPSTSALPSLTPQPSDSAVDSSGGYSGQNVYNSRSGLVIMILGFSLPIIACLYSMYLRRRQRRQAISMRRVRRSAPGASSNGLSPEELSVLNETVWQAGAESRSGKAEIPSEPRASDGDPGVRNNAMNCKCPDEGIDCDHKGGDGNEAPRCTVCIELFSPGEVIVTLACSHVFHSSCIKTWLASHSTCPNCKADAFGRTDAEEVRVSPT